MLKLLLREDRHWLKTEYLFRFLVTTMFLGCILLIILAVTFGAPYALVFVEKRIAESELEKIQSSEINQEKKNFIDTAREINKKMTYLSPENYAPTFFITQAILNQPDGIGINSISYNIEKVEEKNYVNLEFRGVSINRSALVSYQKNLENDELFENVNVPFSSFTKDTDLPFTINVKTVELINYFKEKENATE